MRKTLRASVLMLVLCAPAFAGDITNPSTPQPPPPRIAAEEKATDGNMQDGETDSITETVLSVIESVLALF